MRSRLRGLISWIYQSLTASSQAIYGTLFFLCVGATLGIIPGNVAFEYTWKDHRFCDDCHVHDYANRAYERSVHFGLTTCHDCHRVPIRHYPRNLFMAVFDRPQSPDDIHRPEVESVICAQCHSSALADEPLTGPMTDATRALVVKIDDSPLHRVHLMSDTRQPGVYRGGAAPHSPEPAPHSPEPASTAHKSAHSAERPDWDHGVITCVDCHGSENNRAHRFRASRDNCLQCHSELRVQSSRSSEFSCQECHYPGFSSPAPPKQ